jgi:hypothetical protein
VSAKAARGVRPAFPGVIGRSPALAGCPKNRFGDRGIDIAPLSAGDGDLSVALRRRPVLHGKITASARRMSGQQPTGRTPSGGP